MQEFLTTTQLDNQVASAFLNLGRSLREMPGYDDKSREALLIAARLNNDYAELEPVRAHRFLPLFYGTRPCFPRHTLLRTSHHLILAAPTLTSDIASMTSTSPHVHRSRSSRAPRSASPP